MKEGNPLLAYVHDPGYFLTHLPVYPLLVRVFSFLGWQHALLFVSVAMTCVAAVLFHRLARDVWRLPSPGFLALVFLFLPPRWLIFRSVGDSQSTFIALALGSMLLFEKGRTWSAALVGGVAAATQISGLMLAPAYLVVLLRRECRLEVPRLLLSLLPLGAYVAFCWSGTGDFRLVRLVPFKFVSGFFGLGLYQQVEFYVLIGLVYAVGVSRTRSLATVFLYSSFAYVLTVLTVSEDWSRHFLVIAPTALIAGYAGILSSRPFRWVFGAYVAVAYVYAWGTLPIATCRPDIYRELLAHLGMLREWVP